MGYIAGLVPGTKAASTCQVNAQGTRSPHPRCGSGPIISITSEEDRRLSLGLCRKENSEPRVNFSLPPKASTSQTSSREKIRGSPRFPHRIVPANSLNTIAPGTSISASHRWHSMEDARKSKVSQLPRGSSCSPSCDVWTTREMGIPLSELGSGARGKLNRELAIALESSINSDDPKLGNNLNLQRKGNEAREHDGVVKSELIITRCTSSSSSSSSSPSQTKIRTPSAPNDTSTTQNEFNSQSAQLNANINFARESECSRSSSPIVHVSNSDTPEETNNCTDVSLQSGRSTVA